MRRSFDCAGSTRMRQNADTLSAQEKTMLFLGYCANMFQDYEPQRIEISESIAVRFNPWQLTKLGEMVDGRVCECDWDVSKSSNPIVISHSYPFFTGYSEKWETCEEDRVFYAQVQRKGRPIWGRFVKKTIPRETTIFTMVLRPVDYINVDGKEVGWVVVAAYAGEAAPPFPGDPYETAQSREYWLGHALLDGTMPYRKDTVTTVCPWTAPIRQRLAA